MPDYTGVLEAVGLRTLRSVVFLEGGSDDSPRRNARASRSGLSERTLQRQFRLGSVRALVKVDSRSYWKEDYLGELTLVEHCETISTKHVFVVAASG